jgi:hypothetical protein
MKGTKNEKHVLLVALAKREQNHQRVKRKEKQCAAVQANEWPQPRERDDLLVFVLCLNLNK